MKRKKILLSLALLVPVLVFLFLKFFGTNKFDVPVFHQNRVEVSADCNQTYRVPYRVPEESLQALNCTQGIPAIIVFTALVGESKTRLEKEIESKKLNLILLKRLSSDHELRKWSCIFLLPAGSNAVLVDSERKIRGYYQLEKRDETDRLQVELKILFNEY